MALTITKIPDIRYYLGESGIMNGFTFKPSASDYVTNGYPITAAQVELGYLVGAIFLGTNSTGATYLAQFVEPTALFGTTPAVGTQLNLKVVDSTSGGGAFTEVSASTDLSGCSWAALVIGW
jgi:hypothetical protein